MATPGGSDARDEVLTRDGRDPPADWNRLHLIAALGIVAGTIVIVWLPLMTESFWLDETGTWWFVRSGLFDALGRASRFQAGSFLFHVVEWPFAAIFGRNEAALRLPSLWAGMGSTLLVYLLGQKLFDRGTGALAAMIYVSMTWVIIVSTDARPYSLAIAGLVGSALALTRWLDTGHRRDAIVYVLLFSATIYLHYFMALALLAHIWYLTYRMDTRTAVGWRQVWIAYGGAIVLLAPLVPNLVKVVTERQALSSPDPRSMSEILFSLIPFINVMIGAVLVVAAAAVWGHRSLRGIAMRPGSLSFLSAWILFPFLVLMSVSLAANTNVTAQRYFTSVLPAVALMAGATIRGIGARWPQVVVAAAIGSFSVWGMDLPPHLDEDWRAVAQIERDAVFDPDTPVLLHSGFIEARQIDWLTDSERSSYLNAPAAMYPFEGKVTALPFDLDAEAEAYLEHLVVASDLLEHPEFLLVSRGLDPFSGWFTQRLASKGYTTTPLVNLSDQILVFRFSRRS